MLILGLIVKTIGVIIGLILGGLMIGLMVGGPTTMRIFHETILWEYHGHGRSWDI